MEKTGSIHTPHSSIVLCACLIIILFFYSSYSIFKTEDNYLKKLNADADIIAYNLSETLRLDALYKTEELATYLDTLITNTDFNGITLIGLDKLVSSGSIKEDAVSSNRHLHLRHPLKLQLWSTPIENIVIQRQLNISFISLFILIILVYMLFSLLKTQKKTDIQPPAVNTSKLKNSETINGASNQQAGSIQQLQDELFELKHSKNSILTNMSLELRSPLDVIIGYSELLSEEKEDLSKDELNFDLQRIHSAGKHLHNLLEEIDDLEKIDNNELKIKAEAIDIQQIICNVIKKLSTENTKNRNKISCKYHDNTGNIISDGRRLYQILLNMLSNASIYTKNGEINITIERQKKIELDRIFITITDTGIGTPLDNINKLYKEFSNNSGNDYSYDGSGFGLSISRRLSHLLGGDIAIVGDSSSKGSSFIISIAANINSISTTIND
ncbi:MAG: hypothetical protein DIZ80_08560 [endosymbiont of Galathealinum brachiosum]|uniref:histidine kinase n=1 Tax=endosymbiont of Galathealinum brachiosum TaxID=2200906 RepID=A0A370DBQ8_9GAMM|nr:MAG: hypothetical protein DIZ80_08560 [endosymbiont of Galathealinum brachiosum]